MNRILKRALAIAGLLLLVVASLPQAQAFYETIIFRTTGKLVFSATAPTISAGFGTTPSVASSNGSTTFRVDVGTGGSATTGSVGMPTASTGWNCYVRNLVNDHGLTIQDSGSTTTVGVTNYNGANTSTTLAWTASDVLQFICAAY